MSRVVELPEDVYDGLLRTAEARGVTPVELIASWLAPPRLPAVERPTPAMRDMLWRHVVTLGHPTGLDNDQIDADLAREALDPHEPVATPDPVR